ncbi:hypothetical protein QN416_25360, partial [Glaciimonas sp. Cout2]
PQERVAVVAVAGALGIDTVSRDEQNSKGAAKPVGARQNQRGRIGAKRGAGGSHGIDLVGFAVTIPGLPFGWFDLADADARGGESASHG